MRVRNGSPDATTLAVVIGVLRSVRGTGMSYSVAVPSKKNSSSMKPRLMRSIVVEKNG
jgi:hypothetical protein